jgi:eukaryotic-like serine/threonine-protein kinase
VLGEGGMGIVYKGKHLLMDRPVAIKMLHPELAANELVVRRFLSEAKSLCAVSHPNLVTVFDFGMTPAKEPYIVMEYHEGKALDDLVHESSPIELGAAINIFSQVCDALTGVHAQNIVHRDIKPGNIIISESGQVKLVDFGIAKNMDGKGVDLTMSGEVVGTPSYMSPEQCMGQSLDATSDIYSLGCVMFEFFTGKTPFNSGSFLGIVHKHIHELPSKVPFYQLLVHVPAELEEIIFQTLEKEPSKRQQSAAILKRALAAVSTNAAILSTEN